MASSSIVAGTSLDQKQFAMGAKAVVSARSPPPSAPRARLAPRASRLRAAPVRLRGRPPARRAKLT